MGHGRTFRPTLSVLKNKPPETQVDSGDWRWGELILVDPEKQGREQV
jgi:hypothetical protein